MFTPCQCLFSGRKKQRDHHKRLYSKKNHSHSHQKVSSRSKSPSPVNFSKNQLIINYTFADHQHNSNKNLKKYMRQQVINYEADIIHKKVNSNQLNIIMNDSHSYRYVTWRLQEIVQQLTNKFDYSIKWIGCDSHAHGLSFFYCILIGCLQDESVNDDLFIKFKYSLYQQSKQVLSLMEQQIFIEHLGLIQDSKNIGEFLKKSSHLQSIFIKVFSTKCSLMTKKNLINTSLIRLSKMEQLQWFSSFFPFFNFTLLNQNCSSLTINKQNFYIIQEKQCFFVVQQANNKLSSCRISQIPTRNKTKTQVYGYGLQYIDSLKSLDLVESKHSTTRDVQKYKKLSTMTKSESKQIIAKGHDSKQFKEMTPIQMSSVVQIFPNEKIKDSMNHQKKEQHNFFQKTFTKQIKNELNQMRDKEKNAFHNYLRSSFKCQNQLMSFGIPKIASERVSADKKLQSKPKSKIKKQKQKMIYSVPIEPMPQVHQKQRKSMQSIPNQNQNQNSRQNFIYQSLSPNQLPFVKKQLTPKFDTRIPKFLCKKNELPVPCTLSNSPIKNSQTPTRNPTRKQKRQQKKQIKPESLQVPQPTPSFIPIKQTVLRRRLS